MKDKPKNGEHYRESGGIELIDYITSNNIDFVVGNIMKYAIRIETKNTTLEGKLEDLGKIKYYLEKLEDTTKTKHMSKVNLKPINTNGDISYD